MLRTLNSGEEYMRSISRFVIFVLAFTALATTAHALTPREQLNQMVQQLQKNPGDNALREKIIKLGMRIRPAPALPDTAVAFEGRAQFAFRGAKSEGDFLAAAQEYEKAVAVAPWVPGYYADLCTIYEKAGKFEDAKRHCGFYLTALTDPAQMTDVKRRIAGLEFGIEKTKAKLRTTVGDWYKVHRDGSSTLYLMVTQQDGRFMARIMAADLRCSRDFNVTAATIEWIAGGIHHDTGGCNSSFAMPNRCQLNGESILDCRQVGIFNGRRMDNLDDSYQLKRR